jgi:hypothetical protein
MFIFDRKLDVDFEKNIGENFLVGASMVIERGSISVAKIGAQ